MRDRRRLTGLLLGAALVAGAATVVLRRSRRSQGTATEEALDRAIEQGMAVGAAPDPGWIRVDAHEAAEAAVEPHAVEEGALDTPAPVPSA
jgi:hypothetical protein